MPSPTNVVIHHCSEQMLPQLLAGHEGGHAAGGGTGGGDGGAPGDGGANGGEEGGGSAAQMVGAARTHRSGLVLVSTTHCLYPSVRSFLLFGSAYVLQTALPTFSNLYALPPSFLSRFQQRPMPSPLRAVKPRAARHASAAPSSGGGVDGGGAEGGGDSGGLEGGGGDGGGGRGGG